MLPVTDTQRPTAVSNEVDDLLRSNTSLAVVTPQSLFDETAAALDTLGAAYADGQKTLALGEHITLLLPTNTKGLEFDAVIVIEPGRIASENDHGERLLYVTLTRAVHHLTVIHADPLPATLADP